MTVNYTVDYPAKRSPIVIVQLLLNYKILLRSTIPREYIVHVAGRPGILHFIYIYNNLIIHGKKNLK